MPEPVQTIRPAVFSIPSNRSFADSLVAGLIQRFGSDPLSLARGRILLPNNRAVRSVTDAFVRASGGGLVLPRLIPIGDPDLGERAGGALDPAEIGDPLPPAVPPMRRLMIRAQMVRGEGESAAESVRMAAELERTLDSLLVEEIAPSALATAASETSDLARHWEVSLERLRAILELWPSRLRELGMADVAERRNLQLRRLAKRWREEPPEGFTVAAGISTAAPAVAALLSSVAAMERGMLVLAGLSLARTMPEEEWNALGPDENGKGQETHPQYHLKLLLDRIEVARGEVRLWPRVGLAASTPKRSRVIANAMTSADFSGKWSSLDSSERRLTGVRTAVLPDAASEAQAIALAIRKALEVPEKTVALVTPDRTLARRVSALLRRWDIEADDSAGKPLSDLPPGRLLLGIAGAAAEQLAPVALLAVLKHPLVGGSGEARLKWLDDVRILDKALRGPRPAPRLAGLDRHFAQKETERGFKGTAAAWECVRPSVEAIEGVRGGSLCAVVQAVVAAAEALSGEEVWRGPEGRATAQLLSEVQSTVEAESTFVEPEDGAAVLGHLLRAKSVRPPYGGHPRVFIWGLLEARLQKADLMILGGLNEGNWPGMPAPDPWLAPKIRANLGLSGLEFRIGLASHDFASALGAREVLITRARREGRSPTVASRLWLRLEAMTGGLPRDIPLERIAAEIDRPEAVAPAKRPQPSPPASQRLRKISVTAVDRLKADPFAFYAQAILKLRPLDPVDADHTAAWKGSAVHDVFEQWLLHDECEPDRLKPRAEALLADEAIHPMLRALWAPRLMEAIEWIAALERENRKEGRRPLRAEIEGEAVIEGITLHGRADRIDRLPSGGLAIIDYKTGRPPSQKAVDSGFSLQLGLLGLIAAAGGFDGVTGRPEAFEYWSLVKDRGRFGKLMRPDKSGPFEFLDHASENFGQTARKWLNGQEPFTAKLHPAYAPYGDYDQLMRLEEWYGRG
jgi:ATP-dependent helicase/nuclease subunit B